MIIMMMMMTTTLMTMLVLTIKRIIELYSELHLYVTKASFSKLSVSTYSLSETGWEAEHVPAMISTPNAFTNQTTTQ
jgi:hypothetical protein